jgi:hypothetical protein
LDGPAPLLQAGGKRLRFVDTVAEEFEEAAQTRLPLDKGGKAGSGGIEPGEGFLFEEDGIGVRIGVGDQFDWAEEFTVINLDRSEILGVGQEPILLAMMEAGNVPEDEPFNFPENGFQITGKIGGTKARPHCGRMSSQLRH